MNGLSSIFLKPFLVGKSVRMRLTLTLCAVVVPAILVALAWAWHENQVARTLRIATAQHDVTVSASEIEASLHMAQHFGNALTILLDPTRNDKQLCGTLRDLTNAPSLEGWSASLIEGDLTPCGTGPNGVDRSTLLALRQQFLRRTNLAIVTVPGRDKLGALGIPLRPGQGDFLVLFIPNGFADDATILPAGADGMAIVDPGGLILAEHHRPAATDNWLPAVFLPSLFTASFSLAGTAKTGAPEWYVSAPVGGTALSVIAGYAPACFPVFNGKIFWVTALALIGAIASTILGAVIAVDRTLGRWISYLCRIAVAHSKGRLSVRARHFEDAPREIADLATAVNQMADNIMRHASQREAAIAEKDTALQELHHRVKNNFQIVSSLLTLQKKALSPERAVDFRFVEDHVHAMAVAYRIAYSSSSVTLVSPAQIAKDVIATLCDNAGLSASVVNIHLEDDGSQVDLDRAINVGLTLAYLLPPYLDAKMGSLKPVNVIVSVHQKSLTVELADVPVLPPLSSDLRSRLGNSYRRQLQAVEIIPIGTGGTYILTIPLETGAFASSTPVGAPPTTNPPDSPKRQAVSPGA